MARNEIEVDAPPERVFAVLAEPRAYARWVVGSRRIRRADPDWPRPGSAFDHAIGFGPFTLRDASEVAACEPPWRLRLRVMARPLTTAWVTLQLTPTGGGTRVAMDERAADGRSRLLLNRLTDPLVAWRNQASLRRLKALAEGREPLPDGPLPPRGAAAEGDVAGASGPAPPG